MRERTNDVEVERDVKVRMPDDVVLLTDVYHPVGVDDAPTILERTPYGHAGIATMAGPELATRGYRYVLQACRGTDGSGGSHSYFAEAPDGHATADWIAEQPWFDGRLGSYGASYMGFTQWALASTRPPHLKAMAVALSTSVRSFSWYPGDSLGLEVIIPWDLGAVQFNKPTDAAIVNDISPEAIARRMAELRAAFDHLPLGDVIRRVTGRGPPTLPGPARPRGRRRPLLGARQLPALPRRVDGADAPRRRLARLPAAGSLRRLRDPARHARPGATADRRRRPPRRRRRGRDDRRAPRLVRHLPPRAARSPSPAHPGAAGDGPRAGRARRVGATSTTGRRPRRWRPAGSSIRTAAWRPMHRPSRRTRTPTGTTLRTRLPPSAGSAC